MSAIFFPDTIRPTCVMLQTITYLSGLVGVLPSYEGMGGQRAEGQVR